LPRFFISARNALAMVSEKLCAQEFMTFMLWSMARGSASISFLPSGDL
jgi:hypothetical protein